MLQWWGSRMLDSYGEVCPPDWADVIDHVDDERLSAGLSKLKSDTPIHPPTLGQLEHAIPPKRHLSELRNAPSMLAEQAMKRFTLCQHQLRGPWSYFGPMTTFPARPKVREHEITCVDPQGVVIAACDICSMPSHRLKLSEIAAGVAA